jgi:hypothetical protein
VTFAGLETEYEAADISALLTAGVAPVEVTRQGYRIVQGRTASPSADVTEQELSANTLKDVMSQTLRDTLSSEAHVVMQAFRASTRLSTTTLYPSSKDSAM